MSDVLLNFNTKKEPSVHIVFISQSEARYKANYYKLFSVKVKKKENWITQCCKGPCFMASKSSRLCCSSLQSS